MNSSVLPPRERISPSSTVMNLSSVINSKSLSMSLHFELVTTLASGYSSNTVGIEPEWSCSAWLEIT